MTHTPTAYTILQVSAEYPPAPGGVGDYTYRLGLALRRHRVIVATGPSATATHTSTTDPALHPIDGGWSWRSLLSLHSAVGRCEPDVVHIQYQTGAYAMHPAINFAPRFIHQRFPGVRVVVTMHDLRMPYLFPKAAPVRRWVTRRLLADADAIIVTNEADQDALNGMGDGDPDRFVARKPLMATIIPIGSNIDVAPPPAYNRDTWRESVGADPQSIVVAFFGLVSATKGLLPLVEAFAMLPEHIRLLVIGGDAPQPQDRQYLAEVHAAVQRLNLAHRVFVTGHCESAAVSGHLLASDIVALPFSDGASYRRGSLLAAFAHARPVITTPPSQHLMPPLDSGNHAWFVQPNDAGQLADAITRLAAEPELRRRLGEQGHRLMSYFSWDSIAARHEDVYNALVQRTSGKK